MGLWPRVSLFRSIRRSERLRIAAALERVGLLHLAKSPIETLSGGQFQRMLFARVWLQQAPLIMLDEPLTGVDENTSHVLMSLIEEMHQRGQTILAVLHDTTRVQRYFPSVLRLESERSYWQTQVHKECVS
ncbi:hypothetical protein TUM16655_45670 [Enterobacter cloacae]|nr:hypothetical protein TUM16655_45670 [Enterobacter cloacae]